MVTVANIGRGTRILGGLGAVPGPGAVQALMQADQEALNRKQIETSIAATRQQMALRAAAERRAQAAAARAAAARKARRDALLAATMPAPDIIGMNQKDTPAAGQVQRLPVTSGAGGTFSLGAAPTQTQAPKFSLGVNLPRTVPADGPQAQITEFSGTNGRFNPANEFAGLGAAPPASEFTNPAVQHTVPAGLSPQAAAAKRAAIAVPGAPELPAVPTTGGEFIPVQVEAPSVGNPAGLTVYYNPVTGKLSSANVSGRSPRQIAALEKKAASLYSYNLQKERAQLEQRVQLYDEVLKRTTPSDAAYSDLVQQRAEAVKQLETLDAQQRQTAPKFFKKVKGRGITAEEGPGVAGPNTVKVEVTTPSGKKEKVDVPAGPIVATGGLRDVTGKSAVDHVLATPVGSPSVVTLGRATVAGKAHTAQPALSAEIKRGLEQRAKLRKAMDILLNAGLAGDAASYATALKKLDSTLIYLEGMQAINDLKIGSPERAAKLMSYYRGVDVKPVLRSDGTYDVYINGALGPRDMQRLSTDKLIGMTRELFDAAYRKQIADIANERNKAYAQEYGKAAGKAAGTAPRGYEVVRKYNVGDIAGVDSAAELMLNKATGQYELWYWTPSDSTVPGAPPAVPRKIELGADLAAAEQAVKNGGR